MEAAAAAFGVATERIEGRPGIYRGGEKVGSVGVAVKSGVSLHGLSLNVSGDLSLFDAIIPCGEHELKPASLCSISGRQISLEEAAKALEEALSKALAATPR
jgi:lipoate-protein ligase B